MKICFREIILIGAACSFFLGLGASSVSAARKAPPPKAVAHSGPVDELRTALYQDHSYRSAAAGRLKKAWDALEEQKFSVARTFAALTKSDFEFGDYARWIGAAIDLKQALRYYDSRRATEAGRLARSVETSLTPLPESFPYSPLLRKIQADLAQAEILSGRLQCDKSRWSACEREFERALQRLFGTVDMVIVRPDDLASYSMACVRDKTELCTAWIRRLGHFYPHSTVEFRAIAKNYPRFDEDFQRPPFYPRNSQPYHAPDLDQVAFDEAMASYLDGKHDDAILAFRKFGDEYPRSLYRYRARYWLAQALLQKRQVEEGKRDLLALAQESPLTYYGLLAALGSGMDPQSMIGAESPTATDSDPYLHPQELYHLRRAQKLVARKAYDLAAIELHELRARDAFSSGFLVYLAMLHFEAQSYASGFPILNELINRGAREVYTSFMVKSVFPVQDWNWVRKYSEENGLDPILVMSLMKQESAFDSYAVSSTGALGLMQLMPATAADAMPNQPRAELVKAEMNIRTGTKYLGMMLQRFNGNIALAVAAYNAGPRAVDRWVKASPKDRGLLEFIESIPYRETREYVSSIIRNYYWYARKLNDPRGRLPGVDYFWNGAGQPPRGLPSEATPVTATGASPEPVPRLPSPLSLASPSPSPISPSPTPSGPEEMGPRPLPAVHGL